MTEQLPDVPEDWIPLITWQKYLYKQQREFMASDAWETIFLTGNGAGKSRLLFLSAVLHMLGIHPKQFCKPPVRVRALVPSFDHVSTVVEELLHRPATIMQEGKVVAEVGPMLPDSMVKEKYTKDHKRIILTNGSALYFVTGEQGRTGLRGTEQEILILEEESPQDCYDEVLRGLRGSKDGRGRSLIGLTPPYFLNRGPTWSKRFLEESVNDPEVHVVRAAMMDNPAIDNIFVENFKKNKTEDQVRCQLYGDFPSYGRLIYPFWQDRIWNPEKVDGHLVPSDTPLPENWDVNWVMAFDYHPSKPCAGVWGWVDTNGDITIYDELDPDLAADKTIGELAEVFRQIEGFPRDKREWRRWQDPSARQKQQGIDKGWNAWTQFRKEKIVTSAGRNRDPMLGISIVNEYLQGNTKDKPRLFVFESCKNLRYAMSNHFWKRGSEGTRAVPDAKHSDFPVCLRYILQELSGKTGSGIKQKKWPLTSYEKVLSDKRVVDLGRWA